MEPENKPEVLFIDKVINFIFSWKFVLYLGLFLIFVLPKVASNMVYWWYENFWVNLMQQIYGK